MSYRPRELVVRAREAAALLLRALDRNEMVARFLDSYAAENRRPGRADQPAQYREQLERIRREAILAMVLCVEAALPTRLKLRTPVPGAKRRKKPNKGKKAARPRAAGVSSWELAIPMVDLFREEFFLALGQALDWKEEDAEEFWRDLEVYEKLAGREPHRPPGRREANVASGPFVDRTALLLDPSLLEQARRAAANFQVELHATADRVLRKVFSRRRSN